MGKFVKGDVVVVPFPFSDLSDSKRRPALVLTNLRGDDLILCQITSQYLKDKYSLSIKNQSYANGNLPVEGQVRPNRIFTVDKRIILKKIATVKDDFLEKVVEEVVSIIRT